MKNMKEIVEKVQEILKEQDRTYSRIIQEYSTVKDVPGNRELAERYIQEIQMDTFKQIQELVKPEESPDGEGKPAAWLEKLEGVGHMVPLIQAEINGAEDWELETLIDKYQGTEYTPLCHILLKPRLKELRAQGADNAMLAKRLEAALMPEPDQEAAARKKFMVEMQALLFFGRGKTIETNIQPTPDGRFLRGNGELRYIAADLERASADFSVMGGAAESIVKTRQAGKYQVREVEYHYKWNQ